MVRSGSAPQATAGRKRNRYHSFRNAGKQRLVSDRHIKVNEHNCGGGELQFLLCH